MIKRFLGKWVFNVHPDPYDDKPYAWIIPKWLARICLGLTFSAGWSVGLLMGAVLFL
jgi:hypothetical protein